MTILGMLFSLLPLHHTSAAIEQDPPLYLFIAEMETFIEKANDLKSQGSQLSDDEIKTRITEMTTVAGRAARVYFSQLDTEVKPELDKYLHEKVSSNEDIRHFFVLLGNQFIDIARNVVLDRKAQEKKYRMYSTVGGSLLGLAGGGAVLYFAKGLTKNILTAGLVVVGLGVGGGIAGYAAGPLVASFLLPADPSIKNAEDFMARYPAGEDFILEIEEMNPDIALGLAELQEALNAR